MASVHGHLHGFTWGQSTGQLMPVRCNLHQRGVRVWGSTPQPRNPTQFPRGSPEGGSPVAHGGNPLINTLLLTFLHSWSHFPTPLQCFLRSSPKEPLVAKSLSSGQHMGKPKTTEWVSQTRLWVISYRETSEDVPGWTSIPKGTSVMGTESSLSLHALHQTYLSWRNWVSVFLHLCLENLPGTLILLKMAYCLVLTALAGPPFFSGSLLMSAFFVTLLGCLSPSLACSLTLPITKPCPLTLSLVRPTSVLHHTNPGAVLLQRSASSLCPAQHRLNMPSRWLPPPPWAASSFQVLRLCPARHQLKSWSIFWHNMCSSGIGGVCLSQFLKVGIR